MPYAPAVVERTMKVQEVLMQASLGGSPGCKPKTFSAGDRARCAAGAGGASRAPASAVAMMVGGMLGAAVGSRWLARVCDERLHAAVRVLLIAIGALLIVESIASWPSTGLPFGLWVLALVAVQGTPNGPGRVVVGASRSASITRALRHVAFAALI